MIKKGLRVCFMGTPEFAVESLVSIHQSNHQIVGVVTAVDKPAGRGQKLKSSDVKVAATQNNLPVYQPKNLKHPDFMEDLKKMNPDVIVVVAFRMLPKQVWDFPRFGTFNLHASLLPKYRGAAPIHWAVINGEKETGNTTFFIDEKIDTGEIILNRKTEIGANENVGNVYQRLMQQGAELVIETLDLIHEKGDNVITKKQDHNNKETNPAAPKLNKNNTRIKWNSTSEKIYNLIRGLNPFPVAWTNLVDGEEVLHTKLFKANFTLLQHNQKPGAIHLEKMKMGVYTKDGMLHIEELKVEGKRKMNVVDFLNGKNISNNARFE